VPEREIITTLLDGDVAITEKGEPVLKRRPGRQPTASAQALEAWLLERMPERNVLTVFA